MNNRRVGMTYNLLRQMTYEMQIFKFAYFSLNYKTHNFIIKTNIIGLMWGTTSETKLVKMLLVCDEEKINIV